VNRLRRSDERGAADHGWLDSKHTFSFAGYHDATHMGFRSLRVLNEDRVAPRGGFPTHGHREMEIVSYVIDGALAHRDSTGTAGTLRPGDVQRMTAGTGVYHSEENASREQPVHFLQIWILPDTPRLPPSYEQKHFADDERRGRLRLVGSRDGREGSITIHQDVALYASLLGAGDRIEHGLSGRHAWVQIVRGLLDVNGVEVRGGDAVAISDEPRVTISATNDAELLVFDLA
jgi:redox-sensitive bicupin YhaK (pirin superfamily)